jgi:hypothetical protein
MAQYENVDSRGPGKPYSARNIENKEVAEPGPALCAMQEELHLVDDLLGGTVAMRMAKREHLPQHEYETNRAYERRLAQTYLDNYTLRTLNNLVGKAFKEPPAPGPDMDEQLVEFLDDVDGSGTGIVPFARQLFRAGVKGAVAYLLVDAPAASPDGTPRSKADDAKLGARPTWRVIPTCDMLDYREGQTPRGVKPILARFRDDAVEDDGRFGSKLVERVKVIRPDTWELWELQKGPRGGQPKWVEVDGGELKAEFVPIVPFYTDRSGPGEGRTPLAELAHLNKRHWQSTSDQINILTVCRFPIFAATGVQDDPMPQSEDLTTPQAVVGPNKFLSASDANAKFFWVEHSGAAVNSGTTELERLEGAMSAYGAQFMKKGAQGPETASGRVLDEAEAISPLQSWGLDFQDALVLALSYTAEMMGAPDANIDLVFSIESEVDTANDAELSTLDKARERRDISRRAYLEELKVRGVIKNDRYDIDDDKDELESEPPPPGTGLEGMAGGLRGAKPPATKAPKPPAQ